MAEQTIPKPEVGARFEDRATEGYQWEVVESGDPALVRFVVLDEDGNKTGGALDWPRDRWHALFEGKAMLKLPEEP